MSDPFKDQRAAMEADRASMPADGVPATGTALKMWEILLTDPGTRPTDEQLRTIGE